MLTPAEVYEKSNREYTGKITNYEYSGDYPVLKVNYKGYISFDFQRIYFSETFVGEYLEFRPNPQGIPSMLSLEISELQNLIPFPA